MILQQYLCQKQDLNKYPVIDILIWEGEILLGPKHRRNIAGNKVILKAEETVLLRDVIPIPKGHP